MDTLFIVIFSHSILIAGIIALIRFNKIHNSFRPFIYVVWIACINEMLAFALLYYETSVAINNNIYVLAESLLLLWYFKDLVFSGRRRNLYYSLFILFIVVWIAENLFAGKIYSISSYFRILYSFVLVLSAVTTINKLISTSRKSILRDSVFLLCAGIILYFTIKILVEAFWLYGVMKSDTFQHFLYSISTYNNVITNLIYAVAVLWMPKKQIFTMPS